MWYHHATSNLGYYRSFSWYHQSNQILVERFNFSSFLLEEAAGLNRHDMYTVDGKFYARITQKTWDAQHDKQDDKDNAPSLKTNRCVR